VLFTDSISILTFGYFFAMREKEGKHWVEKLAAADVVVMWVIVVVLKQLTAIF
jgi:hypothetical protein